MTHKILNGPQLLGRLKAEIAKGGSVDLAVAFWGHGAAKILGLTSPSQVRLICNLEMGGTNPAEITRLRDKGFQIRMHNKLHAKLGRAGNNFSFLGSSNFSANGLGYEAGELQGWEEANVTFENLEPSIIERFQELWDQSEEICEEALENALSRWTPCRTQALSIAPDYASERVSLWTAIIENSEKLRSIPCAIAYYFEMSDAEKEVFETAEEKILPGPHPGFDLYSNWSDLPKGFIIEACRSRSKKGSLKNICYRRIRPGAPTTQIDGTEYITVETIPNLPGFNKLKNEELVDFKHLVLQFIAEKKKKKKSRIIPMTKLMDYYANQLDKTM